MRSCSEAAPKGPYAWRMHEGHIFIKRAWELTHGRKSLPVLGGVPSLGQPLPPNPRGATVEESPGMPSLGRTRQRIARARVMSDLGPGQSLTVCWKQGLGTRPSFDDVTLGIPMG